MLECASRLAARQVADVESAAPSPYGVNLCGHRGTAACRRIAKKAESFGEFGFMWENP
jgi:hypothetical protein